MMKLPDLHDATLVKIDFLWDEGLCVIEIDHFAGIVSIIVKETIGFEVDRKFDWGKSCQINEFSLTEESVMIEMQSGDNLKFFGVTEVDISGMSWPVDV